jgi:hypothetical protein
MGRALVTAYRRTGADPPFADPRAAHGVGMEGYFWRFTDVGSGRVVVVLCGACRAPDGPWALVALAAHPGGFTRWAVVPDCELSAGGLGVRAGDVLTADEHGLRVALDGAALDVAIAPERPWPRRSLGALGLAHAVPGLGQYWHPHLLLGRVSGSATLDGTAMPLDGATAYAEKNWGSVFAGHWWWGQAHGLGDGAACVAFAGGRLLGRAPTAVVAALEDRVLRWSPPVAQLAVATAPGRWRIRARGPVHAVELEAEADVDGVHLLPVPVPAERRADLRSAQHLAGELRLTVRRGRRLLFRGASALAGLERGAPAAGPGGATAARAGSSAR